jgi:hypothetical protein
MARPLLAALDTVVTAPLLGLKSLAEATMTKRSGEKGQESAHIVVHTEEDRSTLPEEEEDSIPPECLGSLEAPHGDHPVHMAGRRVYVF